MTAPASARVSVPERCPQCEWFAEAGLHEVGCRFANCKRCGDFGTYYDRRARVFRWCECAPAYYCPLTAVDGSPCRTRLRARANGELVCDGCGMYWWGPSVPAEKASAERPLLAKAVAS